MSNILSPGIELKNNTYRIRSLLGQGGFGAVYLAEDLGQKTLCAIKESFDTSPGAQAQFAQEATILMLLQHPALTQVTDHFVEPSGQQYLVMEYVDGQDLGELLSQQGSLPEQDVLVWMDQVLDAAAHLHANKPRSVIHRDIKPDNIRLLRDGRRVKLVDFGIAKIVRASARFCDKCGHPTAPLPPFQFKQAGYQAADVAELVRGCDSYWPEALGYFRNGQIAAWLDTLGARGKQLAGESKALRAKHSDPSAALEEFLQIAAPTRSLPILTVSPGVLDFGSLRLGDSKVLALSISNSGRGYLHGTLQAQAAWLQVHPARFGCLAGASEPIDVEIKTAGLSGSETGVDYSGSVAILSNRGQQTVAVKAKVVDEPQAHLQPAQLDIGRLGWGQKARGQVAVSNRGGGRLDGQLTSNQSWLLVDPAGQHFALDKGQALPVSFSVDAAQLGQRGRHSGRLQMQTQGRGNPLCLVGVEVDVPYLLDPAQPDSAVSSIEDLIQMCDQNWSQGVQWMQTGRIEAFLRFISQDVLAQRGADSRQ